MNGGRCLKSFGFFGSGEVRRHVTCLHRTEFPDALHFAPWEGILKAVSAGGAARGIFDQVWKEVSDQDRRST